jgi:hypothetical protein
MSTSKAIGQVCLVMAILCSAIKSETKHVDGYCIKQETWGAFTKDDFDKMIEYSVNKELKLLEKMILEHRVINIKKGTKVILVERGLTRTVIRVPNTEIKIWIVTEHLGTC